MCGGTGHRLGTTGEKPLYEIAGRPMIERVLTALETSMVSTIYPVVSPNVPNTITYLEARGDDVLKTPGKGYVTDLRFALDTVIQPVLTVATDLPLLRSEILDQVIADHTTGSVTVAVPLARKRALGLSHDTIHTHAGTRVVPSGVNIVSTEPTESVTVMDDTALAVNVNHPRDARVAERLLCNSCS